MRRTARLEGLMARVLEVPGAMSNRALPSAVRPLRADTVPRQRARRPAGQAIGTESFLRSLESFTPARFTVARPPAGVPEPAGAPCVTCTTCAGCGLSTPGGQPRSPPVEPRQTSCEESPKPSPSASGSTSAFRRLKMLDVTVPAVPGEAKPSGGDQPIDSQPGSFAMWP